MKKTEENSSGEIKKHDSEEDLDKDVKHNHQVNASLTKDLNQIELKLYDSTEKIELNKKVKAQLENEFINHNSNFEKKSNKLISALKDLDNNTI